MKLKHLWLLLLGLAPACGDGDDDDDQDDGDATTDADPDATPDGPGGPTENPLGPVADGVEADPLSSMVAVVSQGTTSIPDHVKALADDYARDELAGGVEFPLAAAVTDSVRTVAGLQANVVVRWLDPLGAEQDEDATRFGANTDFIGYFGDGWEDDGTPLYGGSATEGWLWANHEYVSGAMPTLTTAPTGQHLTLARHLVAIGVLSGDPAAMTWSQADLDTYIRWYRKQVGGSWFRAFQDPATREWWIDQTADPVRYDATEATQVKVVGRTLSTGNGVVPGIMGDCSGAVTPWGTVITAEENVQDYFGDLETGWTADQKFVTGTGWDPGANVTFTVAPSATSEFGRSSIAAEKHNRDFYGYLAEIDPGQAPGEYYGKSAANVGHRKLGTAGRARWENATTAVGSDWRLVAGNRIVMYAGDDRRSGRIYKIVSKQPYTAGMSRAQIRGLLDDAVLYVAHFEGMDNATGWTLAATGQGPTEAAPGSGRWIELSYTSDDVVPNASALGAPTRTVAQALVDTTWNAIGAFPDADAMKAALFTVANKLGVFELNRPEDIEWNPIGTPRLYVAFTNHNRQVAVDEDGVKYDPATHLTASPKRADTLGSVFAMEEANTGNPAASTTFEFWMVWRGSSGMTVWDAANPDNIAIDAAGGVWFGTDGNYGTNGHADAVYYLDLDPAHRAGQPGVVNASYGKAFRVAAVPSDAEATGPWFNADAGTLFISVQHPGEGAASAWPARDP